MQRRYALVSRRLFALRGFHLADLEVAGWLSTSPRSLIALAELASAGGKLGVMSEEYHL